MGVSVAWYVGERRVALAELDKLGEEQNNFLYFTKSLIITTFYLHGKKL
jgi:hypothetical protein